ncbi:MAG TPA: hypothetical protein VH105_00715 [Burkholderiales bacterium]|jgi:hypothetical protein|nr:hypothetical protein [Burkholderiales bacterium]
MINKDTSRIEKLIHSILHPEDHGDSTRALLELKELNPAIASDLARAILTNEEEEIFYRCSALMVLYSLSREETLAYIRRHAASAPMRLFEAMMEEVTDDGVYEHKADAPYEGAVRELALSLKVRPKEELDELSGRIKDFEKTFSGRLK